MKTITNSKKKRTTRRRKWLCLFVLVWLISLVNAPMAMAGSIANIEGDGSSGTPYLIKSLQDWGRFQNYYNNNTGEIRPYEYWLMTNDIRIDAVDACVGINDVREKRSFHGALNGGGHKLTVNERITGANYVGIFGVAYNSAITNLNIEMKGIKGDNYCGFLIGEARGWLLIDNVHIKTNGTSEISGGCFGGFIGKYTYPAGGSYITFSSVILADGFNVFFNNETRTVDAGGFIGWIEGNGSSDFYIRDCLTSINFANSSSRRIGGFIGSISNTIYTNTLKSERCFTGCTIYNINSGDNNERGVYIGFINNAQCSLRIPITNNNSSFRRIGSGSAIINESVNAYTFDDWLNNSYLYDLERYADGVGLIATTMRGNEKWGYDLISRPKLSNTGYTVRVHSASGIGSITGFRYNSVNSKYYSTNADETLTIIPSPAPTIHQRAEYTFTPDYSPSSGDAYIANMDGNNWKLTARVNGEVNAKLINIPYPINLSSNFSQWENTVTLSWTASNSNNLTGKWYIYKRQKDATGAWTRIEGEIIKPGSTTQSYKKDLSITSDDWNKEWDYTVSFIEGTGTAPDAPHSTNSSNIVVNTLITLEIKSFKAEGLENGIKVTATVPTQLYNNTSYSYSLLRKADNEGSFTPILSNLNFIDLGKIEYTDMYPSSSCVAYTYRLEIMALNKIFTSVESTAYITGNTQLGSLKATKGEYNNQVRIEWEAIKNSTGTSDRYKVFRRVANNPDDAWTDLATINTPELNYVYSDEKAMPGVFYRYKVILYQTCNGTVKELGWKEDIGFSQSLGTVSGRITYGSGQAVKDVNVLVVRNDLQVNESQYRSLKSTGEGNIFSWEPEASYYNNIINGNFTYQFWLNPDAAIKNEIKIAELGNFASVYLTPGSDGRYLIRIKNITDNTTILTTTTGILSSRFSHVAIVRNGNTFVCYVVNDEDLSNIQLNAMQVNYTFGTVTATTDMGIRMGYEYIGNIDECRFWSRALTDAEIKSDYNRMLIGSEEKLRAYWTFDEGIDGQNGEEGYFFDISRIGTVFNRNHGRHTLISDSIVPTKDQLALKAITDANGNYQIRGIPFSGEGSSYDIVPSLGVHKFNPTSQLRYISNSSLVHNATDFTDISSFDVSGDVTYEGGNYPVQDCNFEIDGKTVTNVNGTPYVNNNDGTFSISVPIGEHTVRVVKTGHKFANDGYLTMPQGGYNKPESGRKFFDQTRVKLIGRVVGGLTENDKPLGFGESVNNTGASTITLTTALQNYVLQENPHTEICRHNDKGQWKKPESRTDDTTSVAYNQKNIEITISAETGEFVALVYPEVYNIGEIKAPGYLENIYGRNESIDLTSAPVPNDDMLQTEVRSWTDSTLVRRPGQVDYYEKVEKSDTIRYNAKWTTYYQAVPTFRVSQLADNLPTEYFGEKGYVLQDALQETSDTITLWDKTNGYLFDAPVFKQGNKYTFAFEAYEQYINNVKDGKTYSYPINQGIVNMSNTIALTDPEPIALDESGKAKYSFTAGAPDLTTGKHSFMGTITIGAISYYWNQGSNPIEVWHLGDQVTGTDFMTSGPNQVVTILRDPPGSLSYSYLEKGTTITTTNKNNISNGMKEAIGLTTSLGPKLTTFVGLGAGIITESEVKIDISAGLNSEQTWSSSEETSQKTTFTERFQTSSDPLYVGHYGDVFIGNSTNIQYGLTNAISIQKNYMGSDPAFSTKNSYSIAPSVSVAYGQTFDTRFAFTEIELEEIMIPKWESNLANLLLPKGTTVNDAAITYPVYVSNLPHDDSNFGKLNTDKDAFGNSAASADKFHDGPSYIIHFPTGYDMAKFKEDSVMWFNNQINGWKDVLAQNEKEKVEMIKLGNYSFGSGGSVGWSQTSTSTTTTTSTYNWILNPTIGLLTGGEVMGIGLELKMNMEYVHQSESSGSTTQETSITSGFTLQEQGDDDEITVDYGMTGSGTIAFKTRGGRTSCPYEDSYVSKYYQPGQHILSEATMQIEVPVIDVKGSDRVLNVPANKTAKFVLAMKNESETGENVWFQLIIDEKTNPYGADLKIDGGVIGNGRMFLVKAGEVLEKTLTVGKGTADTYEKIGLILRSECQNDPTVFLPVIADTTYVSVEFVPACSEVNIKEPTDNWIVNTNTSDTLRVVLDGFERDFANFGYIKLEARKTSSPDWTQLMNFYADSIIYSKATGYKTLLTNANANIIYNWAMKNNEDAAYELRASAVCVNTDNTGAILSILSEYATDAVAGVKDMTRPESLGSPSPVNGILAAGDDISITFNENIQTGMLTKNNFKVAGTLNASAIAEPNTGLYFNGTGSAYTELPIAASGSFSIETWFKRTNNTAGTLFTYGVNNDFISLGFDATGHAVVNIGNDTILTSFPTAISNTTNTWKYIGLAYNRTNKTISVYAYQDSDPGAINLFVSKPLTIEPPVQGKLYVGSLPDGSAKFQGATGLFHFYNVAHSEGEMSLVKSVAKSGTEPNLIGLWEMNEGEGTIVKDKARSRNLTLNTGWYIYPAGKSLLLNGTNQYATMPSSTFPFRYFDDFTIEMQFKGESQGAATLLSVGMTAYIEFDASHNLVLKAGNNTQVLTNNNLLNGNWHHLALSVKRNGITTAIVDGVATATFSSSIFEEDVAGGFYFLGVHYYENKTSGNYEYTQYFKGNIDEVRVWNTALSTSVINQNRKYKLHGDEVGLLSYYPFEAWQKLPDGTSLVSVLNGDLVDQSHILGGTFGTSDIAAAIIDAPVKETIGNDKFSFVASDNKIVLTIEEELYRMEGVTLEISVDEILDMHGNVSKPTKWIAYVNRNSVNWATEPVDIMMQYGENKSFKATIQNGAGIPTDYYIENLPGWLTVSSASGTLQPLATKELTFTISKSINIGNYEASVVLTGVNNVQKPLPVTLKVTGERPDWSVNISDFEQTMTVVGQVQIGGIPQEDEADILAAFIGEQCVGLVSPVYEPSYNSYFVYMVIGGNSEDNNKNITFKLWDASSGNVYPMIDLTEAGKILTVKFMGDDSYGTPDIPVYFNARNIIEQSIAMTDGWNWVSFNVTDDNPVLLNQFKTNTAGYVTQVKAGDGKILNNNNNSWIGTIASLDVDKMYVVKSNQTTKLKMIGTPVKPAETLITLDAGKWSWIGYTPQFSLPVSEALAGITNPVLNDQVKDKRYFRIMSSIGWIGSLNAMQPGVGYKYKSGNTQRVQFKYPSTIATLRSASVAFDENYMLPEKWNVDDAKFSNNMTVTASIAIDNHEITNGLFEIAAFCGSECRGSAVMEYIDGFVHPYMGFLMVYGENNDNIEFRIFDHETRLEYKASEKLSFAPDAIYGTPDELFILKAGAPTGIDTVEDSQIAVFPNPVMKELFIRHNLGTLERVEISDISGRLLLLKENFEDASINVSPLKEGTYFIHIVSGGQRFVNKFVKK